MATSLPVAPTLATASPKSPLRVMPSNDVFDFARSGIALPRGDLAREDDVFEVEDSKVVIFKLFSGAG